MDDSAYASWNPALRPNTSSPPIATELEETPEPQPITKNDDALLAEPTTNSIFATAKITTQNDYPDTIVYSAGATIANPLEPITSSTIVTRVESRSDSLGAEVYEQIAYTEIQKMHNTEMHLNNDEDNDQFILRDRGLREPLIEPISDHFMETPVGAISSITSYSAETKPGPELEPHQPEQESDFDWVASINDDHSLSLESSHNNTVDPIAQPSGSWALLLDDDDEFLPLNGPDNDQIDESNFFGQLASNVPPTPPWQQEAVHNSYSEPQATTNRYAPTALPQIQPHYQPQHQPQQYSPSAYTTQFPVSHFHPSPPPQHLASSGPQSFVDKPREGYESPYDLPDDFAKSKPRSRPSIPPPNASFHPPAASQPPSRPPLSASPSFFEDLPIAPRRAVSSARFVPRPQQAPPMLPPPTHAPRPSSILPVPPPPRPPHQLPYISQLQQPAKLDLYADDTTGTFRSAPVPIPTLGGPALAPMPNMHIPVQIASRYSPATVPAHTAPHLNGTYSQQPSLPPPPAAIIPPIPPPPSQPTSRFSPAPLPKPVSHASTPRQQPHAPYAPRTSSPLTSQLSYQDLMDSTSPSTHTPLLHRTASLNQHSILETVAEHEASMTTSTAFVAPREGTPPLPPPPKSGRSSQSTSPKKRTNNYAPPDQFVPPKRSQTSSPSATPSFGRINRPASAHDLVSPSVSYNESFALQMQNPFPLPKIEMAILCPQDERANDPLQRWKGFPVLAWSGTGEIFTAFPAYNPRYFSGDPSPVMVPTGGDFKIHSAPSILSSDSTVLTSFPGPLKKGKKKELNSWLQSIIEKLQSNLTERTLSGLHGITLVRLQERLLLWRIIAVMVEHDGAIDGKDVKDKKNELDNTVTEILHVEVSEDLVYNDDDTNGFIAPDPQIGSNHVAKLGALLARGERDDALWYCAEQRLWGFAFFIATSFADQDKWKQFRQEFSRKEIRGKCDKPLATLLQIFAGNGTESVDELVSVSARSGVQLLSTKAPVVNNNALAGLEQWRETVLLMLKNRCQGDSSALVSLGKLLAGYGRYEAAHICFLLAKNDAPFGAPDHPNSVFSLVGDDPQRSGLDFGGGLENIILSEILEYCLSVGQANQTFIPHLQAYKLMHAQVLAELGHRSNANQYCDALANAINSKTKASPYYNMTLVQAVDALVKKLSEAPADTTNGWKSMDKMSSTLWDKLNHFITGDDDAASKDGGLLQTPVVDMPPPISYSPASMENPSLYDNKPLSSYGMNSSGINSRYAPGTQSNLRSMDGGSHELNPTPFHQPRSSTESSRSSLEGKRSLDQQSLSPQRSHSYSTMGGPAQHHQSLATNGSSYSLSAQQPETEYRSRNAVPYSAYSVAKMTPLVQTASVPSYPLSDPNGHLHNEEPSGCDIQPRYESPGFEPLQYEPLPNEAQAEESGQEDETDEKPKAVKSIVDDDEDDDLDARATALRKAQKAKADQLTDEAFRKAAEADAARPSGTRTGSGWLSLGGWFGRGKTERLEKKGKKATQAFLGDKSSLVYDKELKQWVSSATGKPLSTPTPPIPPPSISRRATPLASNSDDHHETRPGLGSSISNYTPPPPTPASAPPPLQSSSSSYFGQVPLQVGSDVNGGTPPLSMVPPSRPATSASGATSDSLDDLLGSTGAPTRVRNKAKARRYVDVMATKK